jgi:hypothetical protein
MVQGSASHVGQAIESSARTAVRATELGFTPGTIDERPRDAALVGNTPAVWSCCELTANSLPRSKLAARERLMVVVSDQYDARLIEIHRVGKAVGKCFILSNRLLKKPVSDETSDWARATKCV